MPQDLTPAERRVAAVAARALAALPAGMERARVEQAIRAGAWVRVLSLIDFGSFVQQMAPIREALASEIVSAGLAHAGRVGVQGSFNRVDPNIVAAAERGTGRMLRFVTDTTRAAVNDLITGAFARQDLTVDQITDVIMTIVGVTPSQARVIAATYRNVIVEAIGKGMSPGQATRLAQQRTGILRARYLKSRARTIARTEVMAASNQGRFLSWEAAARDGLVRGDMMKEWITAPHESRNGKPCEICLPLDGQMIPWRDTWAVTGTLMPPAHPNCRCTAVMRRPR